MEYLPWAWPGLAPPHATPHGNPQGKAGQLRHRWSYCELLHFHVSPSLILEPPPAPAAEVSVCMTSLQLAVTPSMVPLGRLLVFYVRENGEGVADSLQFTVETFFENQVGHWEPNWGREGRIGKRHRGWRLQDVEAGVDCGQSPVRLQAM